MYRRKIYIVYIYSFNHLQMYNPETLSRTSTAACRPSFPTLQGQNLGLIAECKCCINHAGEDGSIWSVVLISKNLKSTHPPNQCLLHASF